MRTRLVLLILAALVAAACSDDDLESPGGICSAQADRWISVQAELLEAVGPATESELADPSPEVSAAFEAVGASILELNRDALEVGCSEATEIGSPLICARLDRLVPGGPAGQNILDDYRARC